MVSAQTSSKPVPLAQLRPGDRGLFHGADVGKAQAEILCAMGMTQRCEVCVCRGGEPCIVRVNATRLGLSAALAARIFVTPILDAASA